MQLIVIVSLTVVLVLSLSGPVCSKNANDGWFLLLYFTAYAKTVRGTVQAIPVKKVKFKILTYNFSAKQYGAGETSLALSVYSHFTSVALWPNTFSVAIKFVCLMPKNVLHSCLAFTFYTLFFFDKFSQPLNLYHVEPKIFSGLYCDTFFTREEIDHCTRFPNAARKLKYVDVNSASWTNCNVLFCLFRSCQATTVFVDDVNSSIRCSPSSMFSNASPFAIT
jgi:hypothetical protein